VLYQFASTNLYICTPDTQNNITHTYLHQVVMSQIPDSAASYRDRAHPGAVRAADQDLVPEPPHEVEEGTQAAQHQNEAHGHQRRRPF